MYVSILRSYKNDLTLLMDRGHSSIIRLCKKVPTMMMMMMMMMMTTKLEAPPPCLLPYSILSSKNGCHFQSKSHLKIPTFVGLGWLEGI
jgi:hypothetical protein